MPSIDVAFLQENLAKALKYCTYAVDNNPTLPILAALRFRVDDKYTWITGSNLETTVSVRIGAKVDQGHADFVVPARTIADFANSLPKERIDVTWDETTVSARLRCGTINSTIKGFPAVEYPPFEYDIDQSATLPAQSLAEMIEQVGFNAARDDSRPILMSISLEFKGDELWLRAADGYRLGIRRWVLSADTGIGSPTAPLVVNLPAPSLATVARIFKDQEGDVEIGFDRKRRAVRFANRQIVVAVQMLEGRFPDVNAIMPRIGTVQTTMMCHRDDLLKACKRAQIFARDNANSGQLTIKPPASLNAPGEGQVTGKSAERGDLDAMFDAFVDGNPMDIHVNLAYMIELLPHIKTDTVTLRLTAGSDPLWVHPDKDEHQSYLIMPMSR